MTLSFMLYHLWQLETTPMKIEVALHTPIQIKVAVITVHMAFQLLRFLDISEFVLVKLVFQIWNSLSARCVQIKATIDAAEGQLFGLHVAGTTSEVIAYSLGISSQLMLRVIWMFHCRW